MIYVTQLIYIRDGQEAAFNAFEAVAIPLIAKYNGRLLLRTRPGAATVIEQSIETPYEIHLVEFDSEQDLQAFFKDEIQNIKVFRYADISFILPSCKTNQKNTTVPAA